MPTKLQQLIRDGEGLTVEFKRCTNELPKSIYETVCSFSNRYGGHILLGIENDGTVSGVAPEAVKQIKRDFANALNNPQRFSPTLFIALEETETDGKIVLWCYVPLATQLVMFGGKIFDRSADGDVDITRNSEFVAMMNDRKRGISTESKVFPYAKDKDLLLDKLIPIVTQLALSRNERHPWAKMTAKEIIRSTGLYKTDIATGNAGYTLAAILLFGREEVIRSCLPGYVTDCILRRDNLDRYDDRLRVSCNLIEAFDRIMDFIEKHTLDKFFIEGVQSVSVRSKIARELVSNTLAHREFTSAAPARVIIERDRIVTDNRCLPKYPGKLDAETFMPQPKNPLIANFFVNIGYADTLGSGVRNLYKYTKIYSGGEPELIEGDVFRTIVPLVSSGNFVRENAQISYNVSDNEKTIYQLNDTVQMYYELNDKMSDKTQSTHKKRNKMSDKPQMSDKMSDKVSDKLQMSDKMGNNAQMSDKNSHNALLTHLRRNGEVTAAEAAKILNRSAPTARRVLSGLVAEGTVIATGANKNRKYKVKR
ncbi:MAG: putative DNA binding domain-containing protein [Clostridiales Family XIII bacterium]|jgi:ATP-dependent DNA helicase RecG|nr:putative DNA binding domain-containing protein [Clostridiales Family XIII bacterium]